MDPPFLNRFEKQVLCFDDALGGRKKEAKRELQKWAHRFCQAASGEESRWTEVDTFVGFSPVALGFAVLGHEDSPDECKAQLLQTVTTDGMVRLAESELATEQSELEWCQRVFERYRHHGLGECLEAVVDQHDGGTPGKRLAIMTFSGIHVPLRAAMEPPAPRATSPVRWHEYRVGQIESERILLTRIDNFLKNDDSNVLVLQMRQFRDCELAQLTRARVEELFAVHSERVHQATGKFPNKHVCVLIHVDREAREGDDSGCSAQFMSGWTRSTIDSILREVRLVFIEVARLRIVCT